MQRRLDEIDQSIARYLARIASTDLQDSKAAKAKVKSLHNKDNLTKEIARYLLEVGDSFYLMCN